MDLDYKITTSAELAGAEAAADSLERQIGKAKALKQDYAALDAQLKTARQSIDEYKTATAAQVQEADELKRVNAQVADSVHNVTQTEIAAAEAGTDDMAQTTKLTLGKRELLESMRGVTREFPMMGEAARAIFNPITAVVASLIGMIGAVFSSLKKVEDMELPDLTSGIDQATRLGTQWDGIGSAVQAADAAFASIEQSHGRALEAVNAELKARMEMIKAVKDLALAELNVQRANGMDQSEYESKKAIIEKGANDATVAAEIKARNDRLEADKVAAAKADADAKTKAKAAKEFKGPASKDIADAEIADQKILADVQRKNEEEAKKRVTQIQSIQSDEASAKGYAEHMRLSFEEWGEIYKHLGALKTESALGGFDQNLSAEQKVAADAKAKADAAEAEALRIKRAAEEKERLKKEAETAANKAREMADALPGKVSAVAKENASDQNTQAVRNQAGMLNQVAGDETRANKDLATIAEINGKANQTAADANKVATALQDAHSAVADAAAVIGQMAGMGANVEDLKKQVAQLRYAIDHR